MSAPNKAKLIRFNELLAKAKALAAGDDETLKEIIKAAVDGRLSDTQIESLVAAAARKANIKAKAAQAFVKEAQAALKRRDANEPAAKAEKRRLEEAAAKAAKIAREAETGHLYALVKDLAESPTLLDDMRDVAHRLGVVNEDEAIAGVYLACTSRLLKRVAISYLRRGASASGKNHLISMVLRLFPKSCIIPISSATPMALIYYRGDEADGADVDRDEGDENALAHKIIVIAEAAVLARKANGDEHPLTGMLRVLLSDGELDHHIPLPSSTGGAPKTVHIKRRGPVVLLLTSARTDVEPEMETRLLSSDADESNKQTLSVIERILSPHANPVDTEEAERWRNLQRWPECDAPYEVVVPFRKALSSAYSSLIKRYPATVQLRMRRDVTALVAAVEASAVLHRAQRRTDKAGRIVAELDDYRHAHTAFNEGLASLYDLRPTEAIKATLAAVIAVAEGIENAGVKDPQDYREYDSEKSYRITVEAVRKKLGVASKETAAQRMEKLVDFGLIEEDESKRGKGRGSPRFYKILAKASGAQTPNVFPHPDDVAKNHGEGEGVKTAVQDVRDVRDKVTSGIVSGIAGAARTVPAAGEEGGRTGPPRQPGPSRSEAERDGGGLAKATVQKPADISKASNSSTSRTSCTADFNPSPSPSSLRGGAKKRGNGQKSSDLTAEETYAATLGAGGRLPLWPDEGDFDVDLRGVDPLLADRLLESLKAHHGKILEILKREQAGGRP